MTGLILIAFGFFILVAVCVLALIVASYVGSIRDYVRDVSESSTETDEILREAIARLPKTRSNRPAKSE